ncbi:hypothetical protein V8C86DRAFT_2477368 [Haematococcus lacustris]
MGYKVLLLIDMNGVVCYRNEEPVRGVAADHYVRRKYFYKRPGVEAFIDGLVDSRLFEVAVYSSVMRHNLLEGLQKIMPRQLPRLAAVLDREMNKADPHGKEEWDTIRDMDKVWRVFSKYDARNTILLDNEARKFCEHPDNGIVVPEFGPAEVQRRVSNTLSGVQAYLLELGRAAPADVRKYMRAHPYDRHTNAIRLLAPAGPARVAAGVAVGAAGAARAEGVVAAASVPQPVSGHLYADMIRLIEQCSIGDSSAHTATLPPAGPAAAARSAGVGGTGLAAGAGATPVCSGGGLEAAEKVATSDTPTPGITGSRGAAHSAEAAVGSPAGSAGGAAGGGPGRGDGSGDGSGGGGGAAGDALGLLQQVPQGTRLFLVCVHEGEFVMTTQTPGRFTKVSGPVSPGIRLDAKMDFHLLMEEAAKQGVQLTVLHQANGVDVAGSMPTRQDPT